MPTYEYICDACQNEFEKFQSIKSDPVTHCDVCGKDQVRRKISGGAAILFKGGGFYETDYRSEGYKAAAKKDSGAAPKPDGGSESKGETGKGETGKGETGKGESGKGESAKSEAKPYAATPPKSESAKSESARSEPAKSAESKPADSKPANAKAG